MCIGSDKLVFDCLGPIVGSMLKTSAEFNGYVYGTMAEPITAIQVEKAACFIKKFHYCAEVVVIDSAVGKREEIGKIKCFARGLRPALGVGRDLPYVGDKSIIGIITTKDKVKNTSYCNVKLSDVYSMARQVCEIILSLESGGEDPSQLFKTT